MASADTVLRHGHSAERRPTALSLFVGRSGGVIVIAVVFIALLVAINLISAGSFGYFEVSFLSSGGATLALASLGQMLVVLSGGFDLSVGAVVSLVNVVLATNMGTSLGSIAGVGVAGVLVGAAVGAFNGVFVALFRLQPIVVTLSSMFLVRGVTLLVLDNPGGQIAPEFTQALTGAAIPGVLPAAILVILGVVALWFFLKGTRFGIGIYAIGSDEESARAAGLSVRWTKFFVYVTAGAFYGAAGDYISAQTGAGDPLVGNPLLLETFTAVVLGGTLLGGGRGGGVGTVLGAYTLMLMVNILLALNVSAYYSSVAEGIILILAVLLASVGRRSALSETVRNLRRRIQGWRAGMLPSQVLGSGEHFAGMLRGPSSGQALPVARPSWIDRNRDRLRFILPAYVLLVVVLLITGIVYGSTVLHWSFYNSLLVLCSFLAILALGQGTVILTGGLDLSVPWTVAFCGIVAAGMVHGSNEATIWVVPLVLLIGALIGALNGVGIVFFGLPAIVMTLATNGILQGLALVYSNGTPDGFASPALRWLMTGRVIGIAPVVPLVVLFVIGSVVLLGGTAFGRRVYAIGNSMRVAHLSGVSIAKTLVGVYALSGLCSALVGILLTGFSGQASLGMGDEYLLPSIAVVVVGGTLITGGRGHYIGMLGGVLLLTALQTLLDGTTLPHAVRDIIFGLVVLSSVLALRDRTH
jgi:ribose transport system permease protein